MEEDTGTEVKKAETNKPARKRKKGGFAVFSKEDGVNTYSLVRAGLNSTLESEQHIKDNSAALEGLILMIVQIKKTSKITVEVTKKITF